MTVPDRLRRGAAYAAGVVVGALPLLLYSWWAFGSPLHNSYEYAILEPGVSGHDVLGANDQGLFGVDVPQRGVAMQLLFSRIGLITVTPVVLAGAAGLVLLWKRGRRREAALAGFISIAFVVYNSGYATPFGGGTPGPRFLIPLIPFLALGFATAYRAWPWETIALAVPSGVLMLGMTATDPVRAVTWNWVERVWDGTFAGSGVWPKLPLAACVLAAVLLCARATPIGRPTPGQAAGLRVDARSLRHRRTRGPAPRRHEAAPARAPPHRLLRRGRSLALPARFLGPTHGSVPGKGGPRREQGLPLPP